MKENENLPQITYIFTIFFLTLGPMKTIPVFYKIALNLEQKDRFRLALKSSLIAALLSVLIALIGLNILDTWKVSLDAILIVGGIFLFVQAFEIVSHFSGSSTPQASPIQENKPLRLLAISPLAVPVIITPYGVVAILLFMSIARNNLSLEITIFGLLLLIMALNFIGMLLATNIMRWVGVATLQIIGWILAILQAGLAVDSILKAFKNLGLITKS
ncbi:MarC family protein [Chroococcus sp. FPU101]|uniref:MarC family protein n=1 Tax=Chroococcus sp. FPU101 TaxID=1974212 RepID=UPI001A8E4A3C|nr:MarC family protein [Chroococcus sp. FPU101]GFE69913.1 multiple antibiotic resistance (MarC)-related protein [Chroococcus sp. FPU101]